MLSNQVYKTEDVFYNSITQKKLPLDSSIEDFKENFFLEDQKIEAIKLRLSEPPKYVQFTLIPSWECNLRCSHCCVLTSLQKKDVNEIDESKFSNFLTQYFTKFNKLNFFEFYFLGGESLLKHEKILNLIKIAENIEEKYGIKKYLGTTTNLAFDLQYEHIEIFSKIDNLTISIDGMEEEHNNQRHAFTDKSINPFQKTISNLKKVIALGFRDKIYVQAALRKEYLKTEYIVNFLQFITSLGVKIEKTNIGSIFPTETKPEPENSWIASLEENTRIRNRPCCKYRYMSTLQINSNNTIYDNFYQKENSQLGTLDNTVEEICKKNIELIFSHMPSLNDKTCIECPALGYCWGGCVSGHVFIGNKPSLHCSRKELVPHIKNLADNNELLSRSSKQYLKSLI